MASAVASGLQGLSGRAYYAARVGDFRAQHDDTVLAALATSTAFAMETTQRDAWRAQIDIMRQALVGVDADGLVAFEFAVPRMGKRIDVLVVVRGVVVVIEFKVGEREFTSDAINQVWDYALDMKNFHAGTHAAPVVPIVVATHAAAASVQTVMASDRDGVMRPLRATPATLGEVLRAATAWCAAGTLDVEAWVRSAYKPTPSIIEAAMALYGGHKVEEISRREAEAINLTQTSATVEAIIAQAREHKRKAICFVTGVPGAGKTLVGLNVATTHQDKQSELHSVFLSGNGPLVDVLCEALARDSVTQAANAEEPMTLKKARGKLKAIVQKVHHFRDQCIRDAPAPPPEHVALFDEAQRAWNLDQTAKFMQQKKGRANFAMSEPAFLISCMDRHTDWAVVVCLVGGGQEINTGEAGIGEWLRAIRSDFAHWHVHLSPHLTDSEYEAGTALAMLQGHAHVTTHESLHLAVSMRSFRAEHVSGWVKALLDADRAAALAAWQKIAARYPIVLTRDVKAAKAWLRERARGNERYGLVVSSQAQRLKPEAIDVRVDIDPVHWFLHPKTDVRSSYYLEDAATEFHVQGLELDWACVVWDADLRMTAAGWEHWGFRGDKWQRIHKSERQAYLKNAYRVLLTRARQGMVLVVPAGDASDPTRDPALYDETFAYLREMGVPVLT
ncbi:MAG TPA: DUF2075 domain-containing protein [Phycisphaerales bacterium]|nr:DUF2075 domain-containing protein [Phycisphaerales bacterium]